MVALMEEVVSLAVNAMVAVTAALVLAVVSCSKLKLKLMLPASYCPMYHL